MYLFSRRTRIVGSPRPAVAWAMDITARANQVSGLGVNLSTVVWGEGVGTLVWACPVESLAELEAANDKMQADDSFQDFADQGASYTTGVIDDALLQIVHGTLDPDRSFAYATSVNAVCASGQIANGMAVGVELAQRAEAITGVPTVFGASMTGAYGGVAWISVHESVQSIEAANEAMQSDPGWLAYVDENTDAFEENSAVTRQTVYRRIV